jgi:branched-chain amino acid transport system ATP-binding protein
MSPETSPAAPLLELHDVCAGYGPFRALFDITFELQAGKVLAVLGANGAGKTTLARVCSGLIEPSSGTVTFDGNPMTGVKAFRFARSGIVHAPEGRSVFATLSVEENLELALERGRSTAEVRERIEHAYEMFPRLAERRRQLAGTMSGGEQRMLSLARVIADQPRLLIADELSLGLAPIIVDEVYATLGAIRDSGTALLIVEQHVDHALAVADEAILLEQGRLVLRDSSEAMRSAATKML